MKYAVVIEQGESGLGAYVPDLPGCVAAGDTREEVLVLIRDAIVFNIDGLRRAGERVPGPSSIVDVVDVEVAA